MNKAQAIHNFWSQFLTAYDETTVPTGDNAPAYPYLTYNLKEDNLGNNVLMHASLWYRSTSWAEVEAKVKEIAESLENNNPIPIDDGFVWIKRSGSFAERGPKQQDDMIRQYDIKIIVEYLTEF